MVEDRDDLQREAQRLGLARLSNSHLEQFRNARAAAERYVGGIPRNLPMGEEPAHTFRASEEA